MVSLEKAGRLQNPFFLSHPPSDSLFTRILASPSIPEAVILTNGNQFARIDARTGSCTCNGSPRSDNTTHSPTSSLVQPSISPSFEPPVFSAAFSSKKLHSLLYSQHESLSCIVEGGHRVAGVPRPPLLVQAVGTVQESELIVADLTFGGTHTPIKLSPPPRSSTRGGGGGIECMAGGERGILFISRKGEMALHGVIIDPPENRGSTTVRVRCTTDHSGGGVVKAISCAPRNFSVAVTTSIGEIRIYSYANIVESSHSSSSSGNYHPSWGSDVGCNSSPRAASQTSVKNMESEDEMDTPRGARLNEDLKPLLCPRLRGKLKLTAILEADQPISLLCISFHALRYWVCAGGEGGVVAVWNLEDEGVLDAQSKEKIGAKSLFFAENDRSNASSKVIKIDFCISLTPNHILIIVKQAKPFAIRRGIRLSSVEAPMSNIFSIGFHSYGPFIIIVQQDVDKKLNGSHLSCTKQQRKHSQSSNHHGYLSILSILDAQMPSVGGFVLPYPVSGFVLEPTSCLLFFSWAKTTLQYLDRARLATEQLTGGWSYSLVGSSLDCPAAVFIEEGLKGNVPSSRREYSREQLAVNRKQEWQQQQNNQNPSFYDLELPLMIYFLRSVAVIIKAGPGGGTDIPAIKNVLFGQPLERDVKMRERGKPRRLVSLPGHTDDIAWHKLEEEEGGNKAPPSSSYFSGHLLPYHIAVGPSLGDKRRFLIAYKVFPTRDWDSDTLKTQKEALNQQPTHSVCGLVTQPGYGELETEANISRLVAAHDGCFVPIDGYNEPCALFVEDHGFRLSIYDIPELNLISSSQDLSQPVARVFPVPQNAACSPGAAARAAVNGSTKSNPFPKHQRCLLYVIKERSHCASTSSVAVADFVEVLVYNSTEGGGLHCPQVPILSSPVNPSIIPSFHYPYLRLLPREHVLDVGFQPAIVSNSEDGKLWGDVNGDPMAFILTTSRVLIVSAVSLQVISSYGNWNNQQNEWWREDRLKPINNTKDYHYSQNCRSLSTHPFPSIPLSASWFGGGVLVLLDDGQVVMLVPGSNTRIRSVCSIERNLCNGGGASIVASLPDRICFLVRGGAASGTTHLLTKPFMPLEPLLAGLLEPEWRRGMRPSREWELLFGRQLANNQEVSVSDPEGGGEEERKKLLLLPDGITTTTAAKIVLRYAPPLKGEPLSGLTGPGVNAGATKAAFDLLMGLGLTRLSLDVAGISKSPEPLRGTRFAFFRRRPWIESGIRCLAAVDEDLPLVAAIEAIGDDPALVECACDVDGMVTPYLPRQQSTLARLLRIIASWCQKSGRLETARRLLDISGTEGTLVELLKSTTTEGGKEYLSALYNVRNSGKGALQAVPDPTIAFSISKALSEAGEMGEFIKIGPSPSIVQRGVFRDRETLLITQDQSLPEELNPTKRLVEDIDSGLHEQRTDPPSLGLRRLMLSCLEEWTGRTRPECTDEEEGYTTSTQLAGRVSPAAAAQCDISSFSDCQSNWVTVGGGQNSDDNICGYWRFSEGEQMAGCGVIASLQVANLSKFGGLGEVRGAEMMETTSPTDPGDGIKVSRAMDVCFPPHSSDMLFPSNQTGEANGNSVVISDNASSSWMNSYNTGIFLPCPRGSALDLGLFHNEPRRSMLTIELYVMHVGSDDDSASGLLLSPVHHHTLVTRYEDPHQNRSSSYPGSNDDKDIFLGAREGYLCHLWSLTVEQDRRICFIPGPRSRAQAKISPSGKIRGSVCSEAGAVPIGQWTHIALTLDASRYEMTADVTLYVDCVPVGRGRCRFNKVPQYTIQQTILAVGPDVKGWRLTELRVWAMCRDSDLLNEFKDIWLMQAEHRKGRIVIRDPPSTSTVVVPPPSAAGRKRSVVKKNELPPPPVEKSAAASWSDACRLPPPINDPTALPLGDPQPSRDARKLALAAKSNGSESQEQEGSKRQPDSRKKNNSFTGSGCAARNDVLRSQHIQRVHQPRTHNSDSCIKKGGGWPRGSSSDSTTHVPPVHDRELSSNQDVQGWAIFPNNNITGKGSSSTQDQ